MTKTVLEQVRRRLEENNLLTIVQVAEEDHLLKREPGRSYLTEFFVAPATPTSDADELHQFMLTLIPEFPASDMNSCWCKTEFHFGRLTYFEKIGEEDVTRIFTVNDSHLEEKHRFKNGKLTITERLPIIREVTVHVYPSRMIVEQVCRGSAFKFFMSRQNVEKFVEMERASLAKA